MTDLSYGLWMRNLRWRAKSRRRSALAAYKMERAVINRREPKKGSYKPTSDLRFRP